MLNELDPVVGQWYLHRDKGETFRVVAVDSATRSVGIQNFDGDVEELDMDAWRDMDIEVPRRRKTGPGRLTMSSRKISATQKRR